MANLLMEELELADGRHRDRREGGRRKMGKSRDQRLHIKRYNAFILDTENRRLKT